MPWSTGGHRGSPVMRRWWEHMRDIMETKPDGETVATPLKLVFHMQ